ncbi:MAG TPA: CheR family methyltransferase [Vicinamibacterales bacterium]|nr:CheR family methyltransferase [Vicinamibacterales bacterium]
MEDGNVTSPEFEKLLEHLKSTRGFDFAAYKRPTLSRRVDRRMSTVGVDSYTAYLDYLQVHQDEFTQLFNSILINVTSFFRDREAFDFLARDVVPKIVEGSQKTGEIRIWSAGCASGEECYSVAILFAEAMGAEQFRERVKIYATDVDEEELAIARQAMYTDRQIDDVPADLRDKYFDRTSGRWMFKKDLRRSVIFGRHDLLDDAPISRVDLLLCRNTLMYFNHEAQAKIVQRFHFGLRDGGFLVLGKAEMLLNFVGAFVLADLKQRVFMKVAVDNGADRLLAGYPERDERALHSGPPARLRDISFDQDPIAQLVVDVKSHLLLANARARELFGLNPRDLGRPLQDLEVSYRPVELRSCIDDAHARRQVVQMREVAWPAPGGEPRYFNVQITPIVDAADTPLGSKVIFSDVTRQRELQDELQRSRQELETAYEELQSTNEELETTNEELQSTVEELETTNEELQSTNEELETMNEELQSTNEELETVNQELRQRGTDLSRSNIFLGGILRSVPLAVIVLDEQLQVELWNDVAADLWGLRADEVHGRHFFGLDIGLPVEQLKQPIAGLTRQGDQRFEAEINAMNRRGRQIRLRVQCVGIGSAEHGRGIILLMQEAPRHEAAPATRH